MAELGKQMGDLGNMQGRIAEDLFSRNAVAQLRFRFIPVANARAQFPFEFGREFDLMAHDGPEDRPSGYLFASWIALVEIKNRPEDKRCEHIDKRANT